MFLGEKIPIEGAVAAAGIVIGIALLSWNRSAAASRAIGWSLLWPISGAVVRGFAQAGAKAALLLWPNPFAASLIGYLVSSATVLGADRPGRAEEPQPSKVSVIWFAATGMLNGAAVLLMYAALSMAPVSLVAPLVATYPVVTALVSAAVLRDEVLTVRIWGGAAITVAAVVYLVTATARG